MVRRQRRLGGIGEHLLEIEVEVAAGDGDVLTEAFGASGVEHEQLRLGEIDGVPHLGLGPPAVHGDGGRAHGEAGPERDDPSIGVGPADGDPIAVADAVLALQPGGRGGDIAFETGEGDAAAVVEDHRLLVAELEGVHEDLAQRARPIAQHAHGLAAHIVLDDLEWCTGSGELRGGREEGVPSRVEMNRSG